MAWYLNRTGQPEGPFDDAQLTQMIQSGQVQAGHYVCPQGSEQWGPVSQVPQFAAAFGGGYAAAPGAVPGAAPGGGMVAGAQPMGGPAAGGAKKKGPPMGIILGIVGVVVVAAAAIGLYFAFSGVSSNLSASVPKDTQVFVEVPSIPAALKSFSEMGILDTEELKTDKLVEDFRKGLEDGFDIEEGAATSLMEGIESIAVAAREVTKKPEVVVLVSFSDADGIEAVLKSDRFDEEGDLAGGTQYFVERDKTDWEKQKDWSPYRKAFAGMSFRKENKKEALVWFADKKILAFGSKDLLEDVGGVITKGEAALKGEEKWSKASFPKGSSGIAFVDSELLSAIDDDDGEKFVKDYFSGVGPFTGSVRFTEAGIVFDMRGEMKGKKVTKENSFPAAAKLDLYEKLPKETVAYLAFSTKKEGTGKELEKRILAEAEDMEKSVAKQVEKMLDTMEDELDFTLAEALDALGDQGVLAVALDGDIEIDDKKKPQEWIEDAGFALLLHIADEDKAKKMVAALKEKGFEKGPLKEVFNLDEQGEGFDADPKKDAAKEGIPPVRVRLGEKHLLIAGGGIADRFVEALEGKNTLADDGAHKKALAALHGDPSFLLWADTGRVGKAVLDFMEKDKNRRKAIEEVEEELGLSIDAIRLEGDNRLTSAIAFTLEPGSDRWGIHVEALNAESLGAMAGAAQMLAPRPAPREFFLPDTGVAMCDVLAMAKFNCGERIGNEALKADGRADEARYKAELSSNPSRKTALTTECSKKYSDFMRERKECAVAPPP